MDDASQAAAQDTGPSTLREGSQDDVKPSDSISNVQSRRSAQSAASGKEKKKERLKLDEEIAAHLAKVSVLTAASTSVTDRSNAMNSYLKNEQGKTAKFSINAGPFIPQRLETPKQHSKIMVSDQVTRPKTDSYLKAPPI
ncbi:hypothetical protein ABVT39_014187 [Epinephelus coioides]